MNRDPARGRLARGVVVALWLPYLALNTAFPGPGLTYGLGLAIAAASVGALLLAGATSRELFLRPAPLSRVGAVLLLAVLVTLPLAVAVGRGQRLEWLGTFGAAPASAIAQEVYFRAALLAALDGLSRGRHGVSVQALLFAFWHARAFREVDPGPALLVLLGAGVVGLAWGWQVRRDRTVIYATIEHALLLAAL